MDQSDLVVINTCAIREAAEAKVIGRQGELARLKAREPVDARRHDRLRGSGDGLGAPRPALPGRRPVPAAGPGAGARRSARAGIRAGSGRAHDIAADGQRRRDDDRRSDPGRRRGPPRRHARRRGGGRRGAPPLQRERVAADHLRLRQDVYLLHRAVQPRPGALAAVRRNRRRGTNHRRAGLPRGHAPRPERQLLRPRPRAGSEIRRTSAPSAGRAASSTSGAAPTSRSSSARSMASEPPTGARRSRACGSSPRTRGTSRTG